MRKRIAVLLIGALLGVVGLILVTGGFATTAAPERAPTGKGGGERDFRAARLGTFDQPTYVTGPRGAGGRLFVVEQGGVIRVVRKGRPAGKFLDLSNRVESGGERGLLSVAFAPDYRRSGLLYVYFTRPGGDIVIQEYRRAGKRGDHARSGSARDVIEIEHSENSNHNGGQLQFGPDGLLYIGTGDGGSAYDPPENAQNKESLLGKLLRIDPRGKDGKSYTVPSTNPFVGREGADEIYALGLRNPFRFSFDRKDGALTIGDVGQDQFEEVDYETPESALGANFGWDALEGRHPLETDPSPAPADPEAPIFEYSHDGGNCSITGGYVSRDPRIPSLLGRYLYADFCKGEIRSLVPRTTGAGGDSPTGLPSESGVSSFGEDAKGHLYYANLSSGEVFAIQPTGKRR